MQVGVFGVCVGGAMRGRVLNSLIRSHALPPLPTRYLVVFRKPSRSPFAFTLPCVQYQGIDIDMTFAELSTPVIPRGFNILDDEILRGVDPGTVLSLNGPRATELIRILVPESK